MDTTTQPIIDVTPVEHAREATEPGARGYCAPSYGSQRQRDARTGAVIIDDSPTGPGAVAANRIGAAVQTAGGVALMAIGLPLLILPGPGVLAIGGGAAIAAGGIKKLLKRH